jgi:hypothetical protein
MVMFSQRHYKAIADCLKERREEIDHYEGEDSVTCYHEWETITDKICRMFERDNYNFKPDRFLKAAGFSE